nr:glucosaminidase domain-containing protein [uncultured Flavobacterium sp.]
MKKAILFFLTILLVGCSSSSKVRVKKTKDKINEIAEVLLRETPTKSTSTKNTDSSSSNTEVLEATSKTTVTHELINQYIQNYKHIAQENMRTHKIPASITMAQGILESGSGTGALAQRANNHFGIKCHTGWTGESVRHDDDALQECFRKYNDPADSYRDHSLFLTGRSRYNNLFKLDIYDYKAWARGLKAAGYATDPKYPDKLISLIERYNLQDLDRGAGQINTNTVSNSSTVTTSSSTYVVAVGDTLYSISRKFNTTVQNIKSLNNLTSDTLSVGQTLKI